MMISPKKRKKIVASPSRKSGRINTLKTKDIKGPGRDHLPDDPVVIPEEETTIGSACGKNKWSDIKKSMTQ